MISSILFQAMYLNCSGIEFKWINKLARYFGFLLNVCFDIKWDYSMYSSKLFIIGLQKDLRHS